MGQSAITEWGGVQQGMRRSAIVDEMECNRKWVGVQWGVGWSAIGDRVEGNRGQGGVQ